MRRAILAAAALACACASPRAGAPVPREAPAAPRPTRPLFPPATEVKDPNFVLVVSEVVPDQNDESVSFTKAIVDGREVGRTEVGRKSEERTLKLKLPLGNQPIRLEQWVLPDVGDWVRLDDGRQPRERFVRIEDGTIARLELRFSEGESSNTLSLSREPAPR